MSSQELDRLQVIQRVLDRQMTRAEAARTLCLSARQLRRLVAGYRVSAPVKVSASSSGVTGSRI